MSDWWLSRASGAPEGPFPTQTLAKGLNAGQIPTQAYVCRVGDQRWLRISQVDEIWDAAHPDQSKTQVTEQPWFQKAADAQLLRDVNNLDDDDENERTQIITPMPMVSPGSSSRAVPTPLPQLVVPPSGPSRALPTPLPQLAVPPGRPSRALPLPELTLANQHLTKPIAIAGPTTESPVRPKVPTLEGIQDPTRLADPHPLTAAVVGTLQSVIGRVSASPATAQTVPTPEASPFAISPAPKERERALPPAPTLPASASGSGKTPETRATTPLQPANRGLVGLGLSPLPKATVGSASLPGLGALPSPPKASLVNQTSLLTTPDAIASPGSIAAVTTPSTGVSVLPPILGASFAPKPLLDAGASRRTTQGLPESQLHQESTNGAMSAPLLHDADVDEVTTVASAGQLPQFTSLGSAFEEDVTTIVTADRLPAGLEQHPISRADETTTTRHTTNAQVPPEATRPSAGVSRLDFSAHPIRPTHAGAVEEPPRHPALAVRTALQEPTRPRATTTTVPLTEPTVAVTSPAHDVSQAFTAPIVGTDNQSVSTPEAELSTEIDADPAELLEEDTDDASLPNRMAARGPHPSSAPMRREKASASPSGRNTTQLTGPVISVPPKATHQAVSPSIVLRPEPAIHQEATKPAIRALRPPGVVQISYGTLVIAVLGVALLVLVLVLLLK